MIGVLRITADKVRISKTAGNKIKLVFRFGRNILTINSLSPSIIKNTFINRQHIKISKN